MARPDVEKLSAELLQLRDLQLRLLKRSTFGGMSDAEKKEYEALQKRVNQITEALKIESSW